MSPLNINNKNKTTPPLIRMGVTDLSFHHVTAAIVTHIMMIMGKQVIRTYDQHEENFIKLKNDQIDFICSAWLPHSHGIYKDLVEQDVPTLELGLHYQPYAFWGVPDYVPYSKLNKITDLLKPSIKVKTLNNIQGIGDGAGITRFSKSVMKNYGLTLSGYEFKAGSQEDCINAYEQSVAENKWVIVPIWQPQFLHHKYIIRELEDPKGLLGGKDRAVLLARKDSLTSHFTEQEIQVLNNIELSNKIVSQLDYSYNRLEKSADEVAKEWLRDNTKTLINWLDPLLIPEL